MGPLIGFECLALARWIVFLFRSSSILGREQFLISERYLHGYTTRASCESYAYFVFWWCWMFYPLVAFQECLRVVCHFQPLRRGLGLPVESVIPLCSQVVSCPRGGVFFTLGVFVRDCICDYFCEGPVLRIKFSCAFLSSDIKREQRRY